MGLCHLNGKRFLYLSVIVTCLSLVLFTYIQIVSIKPSKTQGRRYLKFDFDGLNTGYIQNQYDQKRNLKASFQYSVPVNPPETHPYVYFTRAVPLIWIGGVPRSGTTLMRAMLDAHKDIRCGEETRVIPQILGMHNRMQHSDIEMTRLEEAHINQTVLNNALGAYILSVITQHGEPANRLCNKDPFTLQSIELLMNIFPKSKFIFMIRDGRAAAHSIVSRKVTIKGFDEKTYRGALTDWNRAVSAMYDECLKAGDSTCLPVHYEQLVLHPKTEMEKILTFLDLPWDDSVIHHEKTIGVKGGVSLSKKELSTDQVNKPVNLGALVDWVPAIPDDVKRDMEKIAPMLEILGYDPLAYPPNYGTPDLMVIQNSDAESIQKYQQATNI